MSRRRPGGHLPSEVVTNYLRLNCLEKVSLVHYAWGQRKFEAPLRPAVLRMPVCGFQRNGFGWLYASTHELFGGSQQCISVRVFLAPGIQRLS